MPLARSFLYVPANRDKFLEKAIGLPSDAFIFDLEDSVPSAEKETARAGVRAYAPKIPGKRVWVRTNGLDTGLAPADLDAAIGDVLRMDEHDLVSDSPTDDVLVRPQLLVSHRVPPQVVYPFVD